MLHSISLDAKSSDPKPIEVERPQKQIAFPTPFHTLPRSPPQRRSAKIRWML